MTREPRIWNGEWPKKKARRADGQSKGTLRTRRQRKEILEMLGEKCRRCGFDDPRALQIDHIFACAHTGEKRRGRSDFYCEVIRNPRNYQLLCANCNWIKRVEQKEYNQG